MDNQLEINKLDISTNTQNGTQVGGSAVIHGNIQTDLSTSTHYYNYNAETLIVNQNKGRIDPINFNFDIEALQGTTANRDAELEQMRTALARPTASGAKLVVLVGMGGAGKTTLAKLYFKAEKDRESFYHLIWIDAEEPESVTEAFNQLLTDYLNIHRQFARDQLLISAVYNSILKQKTIIVFDNVEQVERIRQFFPKLVSPKNPPPHVIVTTRIAEGWDDYQDHLVCLRELSPKVCKDYIWDSLAMSPLTIPDVGEKWEELAQHFGSLMMALRTATMSIVEQNKRHQLLDKGAYKLEDFLREVKEVNINEDGNQRYYDPTEATYRPLRQLWTSTLDKLSQLQERILEVLSFLLPTGVPIPWFRIICATYFDSNERILMDAINYLISWSLVEKSGKKYLVHRVLHSTLLSRIMAEPDKLTETLDWLLPRIEELYLKLAADTAENKLEDFYPHLHTLLKHIELHGNVPDSAVSFLVNMKLPGGYVCERLLKELVGKLLKKNVCVSCRSLGLVLAQSGVDDSDFLLPGWIRNCSDQMTIQEQLRQIQTYLTTFDSYLPIRQLDLLFEFYSAVVQVLEKWEPESNASLQQHSLSTQSELDVLNIVERLCHGLDQWMHAHANKLANWSKYTEMHTVLQRLEKVFDAARAVVFRQLKNDNLETKLEYVYVLYKLFQWLVNLKSHPGRPLFALCEMTALKSAFNFTGFDRVMIGWYQVQLERFYHSYIGLIPTRMDFSKLGLMKLEATFIVAVITSLVTSLSDSKQDQLNVANKRLTKSEAKIPDQVIQFLNFFNNREKMFTKDSVLNCFIGAYVVYLALEPHLDLLERILDRLEKTNNAHQKQQIIVEMEPFVESMRRNITKYTKLPNARRSLLVLYSGLFAHCRDPSETKKLVLPNVEKLIDLTDKILTHCEARLPSPLDGSDPGNLERLMDKLQDDYYHRRGANEPTQLRTELEKAYKTAQDGGVPSAGRNCRCVVARIQTMLARLHLEDGKNESAIQEASAAFNHHLYCQGSNTIDTTIEVLFDAFSMCDDSQARKLDLLRKRVNGHMDIHGPDHRITKRSHNKLIRLLCSTGSILEAADFVETLIDSSSSFEFRITHYSDLTVVLLLIMSGETERVVSLTKCMLRHVNATNLELEPDQQRLSDKICQFATFFGEVGASGLASFKDHETSKFRKCALTLLGGIFEWPPKIYQKWLNNTVQFQHVNGNMSNEEDTSRYGRLIDTTEPLYQDDLMVLWFDTMEQVLRREPMDINASLFAPLVHQLELRNVDMDFKLIENELEWSIKCFVGMFQRQQLWFQKTSV